MAERKRSITIAGHRTSISLELEFWDALQKLSAQRGKSITALVAEVDRSRGDRNLSSALRVWVLSQVARS
ncbi:MAG: ribbon-helix-helix domain-containing protein [Hyphomicrobiales bacterium]